jgi:hypothetical protein
MRSTIRTRLAARNRAVVSSDQDSVGIVAAPWEPGGRPYGRRPSMSSSPPQLDPTRDGITAERLRRWHVFAALGLPLLGPDAVSDRVRELVLTAIEDVRGRGPR